MAVHSGVGYEKEDIVPLLTPFCATQIPRMPRCDQRPGRNFYRKLSKCPRNRGAYNLICKNLRSS